MPNTLVINSFLLMRGISEFSATALFMLISCMGSNSNEKDGGGNLVSSLIYGMAIVVVMHIFGFISGAHANPCVTIACCMLGYIEIITMLFYIICQMAGAAFGYYMLLQMITKDLIDAYKPGVCLVAPLGGLTNAQILSIEGFLTSVVMLAWSALWDVRSGRFLDSVTLRMGCLVTVCNLIGGKLTGATMNPAKLLIPSFFNGDPETVLWQLGGQLLSSVIVPQVWQLLYTPPRYRPLQLDPADQASSEFPWNA